MAKRKVKPTKKVVTQKKSAATTGDTKPSGTKRKIKPPKPPVELIDEDSGLNARQLAFVREYLLCRNASEAVRRAGYYTRSPHVEGSRLLANPNIQAMVGRAEKKVAEKFEITHEKITQELAAVAFGNVGNVMHWSEHGVSLIPKEDQSEADMKFIESISETQTEHGSSIKMTTLGNQKVKALELLGKHVGMWKGDNGAGQGTDKDTRKDALERVRKLLSKRNGRPDEGGAPSS